MKEEYIFYNSFAGEKPKKPENPQIIVEYGVDSKPYKIQPGQVYSIKSIVSIGTTVESGTIIGYLRTHDPATGKEEIITIRAKVGGVVAKIPLKETSIEDKDWTSVDYQGLFIITPTAEK